MYVCSTCGSDLETKKEDAAGNVRLIPCLQCMDCEFENGHADGHDEGWDEGYNEAKEEFNTE